LRVQPKYLVVERIVLGTDMYLSSFYVEQYQTCRCIQPSEDSPYTKGQVLLVANRICFDKAPEFGPESYYIDAEEVFGTLDNGIINPSNNIVYIKADKTKKSKMTVGNLEFFNDITYKPLETENVTQDGEVLAVCKSAKHSMFDFDLNIEVVPGDHVYAHHFLTDEDNEREIDGEMYYEIGYEHLYCKVVDGKVKMLNDWNFVVPVEATEELSESGIVMDLQKKNQLRVGVVKYPCQKLLSRGIEAGDKVYFKRGREYKIDVEGERLYRIETNDILSRYENMEAIGEIVVVKEVKVNTDIKGMLSTVNQAEAPDRGEILSVGADCKGNLNVGDIVLFRKMANTEVEIDGEKVLLMLYKNIYVKV
jgi:co-chaperonin GroES (HSP10)